eukprot:366188-Chlamydomonas_euryale.AAC.2
MGELCGRPCDPVRHGTALWVSIGPCETWDSSVGVHGTLWDMGQLCGRPWDPVTHGTALWAL